MSLSGSDEDEQILLLEARRADHSPPRKKRKLNNEQSESSSSASSSEDTLDEEEKNLSDKENMKMNSNKKKRRRPSTQINPKRKHKKNHKNHSSQSLSTQAVYRFGDIESDEPLNVQPGAIIRLELVNFLCHSNFQISFHPNINIIYGQNGSGKSAIEAGISMALGVSAKKTMRGNNVNDVIKFGKNFALVRLFLHNRGPEALPEYGPEIVIERKLSQTTKNGTSTFKVLDCNLKTIKKGTKAVREVVDKLNLHVDNPCVILKQATAKQFLNSTKNKDKYKFFMQSSKLGDYEKTLDEAMDNVNNAKEQQKQTKYSFSVIKQQYNECKREYDTMNQMQQQQEKIKYFTIVEKWMKYNQQTKKLNECVDDEKVIAQKLDKGNKQLTKYQGDIKTEIEKAKQMKQSIQDKMEQTDDYETPINELKREMRKLENDRKQNARAISAKTKYVDISRRKIRDYKDEYKNAMDIMKNDEKGKKLASINEQMINSQQKLKQLRLKKPDLEEKSQESIELKENQQKLTIKNNEHQNKQTEIRQIENNLKQLNQRKNRTEFFCPPDARKRRITVKQIRDLLTYHRRKFNRPPIGPIGDYIEMKPCQDNNRATRNTLIVQSVLNRAIFMWIVDTSHDQQLFQKICRDRFNMVIPCLQYKYSDQMYNINTNPFEHYQPRDSEGPLYRVSDLFTIKDNNAWIYNTLITNSNCERVYAHGTLKGAKWFLERLDQNKLPYCHYVLTYLEKDIFKVSRRGRTCASSTTRPGHPILASDITRMKSYYQNELNTKYQEINLVKDNVKSLREWLNTVKSQTNSYQRQLNRLIKQVKNEENKINKLSRDKTEIEEDDDDDNEIQEQLDEIQNSIKDEESNIESMESEIAPYHETQKQLLTNIAGKKLKLQTIENKLHNFRNSLAMEETKYQQFCDKLKKRSKAIEKIPTRLHQYEQELQEKQENIKNEQEELNKLHQDAANSGDSREAIKPENYPKNPKNHNRKYKLRDLVHERKQIAAAVEEWKNHSKDPEEIRKRFDSIRPKYETHEDRVRNCNNNVDQLNILLRHRRKEYQAMKQYVSDQLSTEFRFVMRQQGHDGTLNVDFKTQELSLNVHMSSHDGGTQVVNSKTLSGGERSFTQVALIMALQKFSGSPMCIYDEFDVFMDSVNRGNSIKILLKAALGGDDNKSNQRKKKVSSERQYIFITPNDVSPIIAQGHKNLIRIHKLNPPRKGGD